VAGHEGDLTTHVTTPELRQLYLDLKGVEGNLRVELRRGIKEAAQGVADAAKAKASWSRRIPAAVKVKPSFSAKSTGVSVEVDGKKAPHARPIDHAGKPGTFQHPVFGKDGAEVHASDSVGTARRRRRRVATFAKGATDTWVAQPARPFFAAAVDAKTPDIEKRINQVADEVARKAGFIN
jgi:hypothetical protein